MLRRLPRGGVSRASPGDDGEDLGADLGVGVGVPVNQRVPAAKTAPRSSALGQAQGTGAPLGQDAHRWQALVRAGPTGHHRRSGRGDGTRSSHDGGLRSG